MSDVKHTPGPWVIELGNIVKSAKSSESLAMVRWYMRLGSDDESEGQANARLIAAAPELLEALEEANDFMENACKYNDETYELIKESIKTALAKAKGETCTPEA